MRRRLEIYQVDNPNFLFSSFELHFIKQCLEIYDQLQLAATVFAGVALLNALILGGYVLHHCQFAPAGCKSVAPNENASAM